MDKREGLNLREIGLEVVKHIRKLRTKNVFGKLEVKIENGGDVMLNVSESIHPKNIK